MQKCDFTIFHLIVQEGCRMDIRIEPGINCTGKRSCSYIINGSLPGKICAAKSKMMININRRRFLNNDNAVPGAK